MAKKIRRKAIIIRTPIILNTSEFHTIAAHSDKYENALTIGIYPDLETARKHYTEDINKHRGQYKHFAICEVVPKENERCEENGEKLDE